MIPVNVPADDVVLALRVLSSEGQKAPGVELVRRPLAFDGHGSSSAADVHEIDLRSEEHTSELQSLS